MADDIRDHLYTGELDYFRNNPHVAGMAAEDNKVILNPFSKLSPKEMGSVIQNERARILMRVKKISPRFKVTDEQKMSFAGTPYERDDAAMKETIAARILSGDPSARNATPEQIKFAEYLKTLK